jgi:metal-responsive CopG/Arc/MetJ family transcriptional regulator
MSKVMISLPEAILREIDRLSKEEHRSRSEFLREAVRFYIEQRKKKAPLIESPQVQAALRHMKQVARRWRGDWDSAEIIRQMRDSR